MGLNFRKSITLFKGVKLNLSKSGASLSFGGKGIRKTVSTSGKVTTTVGIPGTGIYYTDSENLKTKAKKKKAASKKTTAKKTSAKKTTTKKSSKSEE